MKPIRVVPVGAVDRHLLEAVRNGLEREFRTAGTTDATPLDPAPAYHPERTQYHSTALLGQLGARDGQSSFLLGVASVDLYIPILTFVFGEAQVGGPCAIVSCHRLQQQFYGLPPDDRLLEDRLIKEAIHELGHVLGLHHCENYECVMAASHAVEWLDLKERSMCTPCRSAAGVL